MAGALFPVGYGLDYRNPVKVGPVNEDPHVDMSSSTQASIYMVRGKVPAPWRLALDGAISSRAIDLSAQEDARQFSWNAKGTLSIEGAAVNLAQQADQDFALTIDWRIDHPATGPVMLSFSDAAIDLRQAIRMAHSGAIVQTRIPLRCFRDAGANLNAVGSPLRIEAPSGFVASIRNVRIQAANDNTPCPEKIR
jgi:beta-glucosidase